MQGRVPRNGIPVTLNWQGLPGPYAPSAQTVDLLTNNFSLTVTYGGSYLITTGQDRYLNLTSACNKTITVDAAKTLAALVLRGGNVKNDADSIDKVEIGDAAVIGNGYGSIGDPSALPGDANFDGRVNILDLALVGGNFNLTSATAYTSWVP